MAKKGKEPTPNPSSAPNRDIIQRLNFLYQASAYLNGLAPPIHPAPEISITSAEDEGEKKDVVMEGSAEVDNDEMSGIIRNKRKATTSDLARSYVKSMKIIGQKTNVKMDPSVKRTLCKGCNALLIPGISARVRIKQLSSHGHAVNYTCLHCLNTRRIPAPPVLHDSSPEFPKAIHQASKGNETKNKQTNGQPMETEVNEKHNMAVTETIIQSTTKKARRKRANRKHIKPRPVPFFERACHVLFVGNEVAGPATEAN